MISTESTNIIHIKKKSVRIDVISFKLSDYGQSYLFNWTENFTKNRKCILTIT